MEDRILVIDDSSTIQKVIKIALAKYPVKVFSAGSIIEAMHELDSRNFTAILADSVLPGTTIPDSYVKLREKAQEIPVILLIGSYEGISEENFRESSFEHFLKKPFEPGDVIRALERALQKHLIKMPPSPDDSPSHLKGERKRSAVQDGLLKPLDFRASDTDTARKLPPLPPLGELPPLEKSDSNDKKSPMLPAFTLSDFDDVSTGEHSGAKFSIDTPKDLPVIGEDSFICPHPSDRNDTDWLRHPERSEESEADKMSADRSKLEAATKSLLDEELAVKVRKIVEEYCREHFDKVAREVITAEVRRLADEKTSHLTDH